MDRAVRMVRALPARAKGRARSPGGGCDRGWQASRWHEGRRGRAVRSCDRALPRQESLDPVYKAALEKFGERGIMDIIGIIGYYDLVSMTLITMQAAPPNDSVKPLPILGK